MKTNFILRNNLVYQTAVIFYKYDSVEIALRVSWFLCLNFSIKFISKTWGSGFFIASSAIFPSPFFSPICHLDYILFAHLPSTILRLLQLELMWWVWNTQHEPQSAQLTLSRGWKHWREQALKNLPSSDKGEFSVCVLWIMLIRSMQWWSCSGSWAEAILYTVVTFSWLNCLHYVTEVTARYFNKNWSDH